MQGSSEHKTLQNSRSFKNAELEIPREHSAGTRRRRHDLDPTHAVRSTEKLEQSENVTYQQIRNLLDISVRFVDDFKGETLRLRKLENEHDGAQYKH